MTLDDASKRTLSLFQVYSIRYVYTLRATSMLSDDYKFEIPFNVSSQLSS